MSTRRSVLLLFVASVVVTSAAIPAIAGTVYTPPYDRGASSSTPFAAASYNVDTGYCYARCRIGSGSAGATAILYVDNDLILFAGELEVAVDCTIEKAFLFAMDFSVLGYASLWVTVHFFNYDLHPAVEKKVIVYTATKTSGLYGLTLTNIRIQESVTFPIKRDFVYSWAVGVSLSVRAFALFGDAGVCLQSGSWFTPARMKVNSITLPHFPY